MIPLVGHAVPGQGLLGELNRHFLVGDPDRRRMVGQTTLSIDPPVPEADVPRLVNPTGAEDRGEAARQLLLIEDAPLDPVEHLGRTAATILPLQVGPMLLAVEVVDPGGMALEQLVPGLGPLEIVVGHPPLDVEVGLDIGLPGLTPIDLLRSTWR